jgi:CheY-like chemotaxis protein
MVGTDWSRHRLTSAEQRVPSSERRAVTSETRVAKVLVIDDCEVARTEMLECLRRARFSASGLESPIGATRVLVDQAIDVVVIDIQMPSIRGDRLAALFRDNPRFTDLGVILVSGGSIAELEQLGRVARADAVLPKSKLDLLVPAVNEFMRRHRQGPTTPTRGAH